MTLITILLVMILIFLIIIATQNYNLGDKLIFHLMNIENSSYATCFSSSKLKEKFCGKEKREPSSFSASNIKLEPQISLIRKFEEEDESN